MRPTLLRCSQSRLRFSDRNPHPRRRYKVLGTAVYKLAVDYLGFPAEQILMVACHKYDLAAARAFGMKTAFISRPFEFGPNTKPDTEPKQWYDIYTESFVQL